MMSPNRNPDQVDCLTRRIQDSPRRRGDRGEFKGIECAHVRDELYRDFARDLFRVLHSLRPLRLCGE